MTRTKRRDDLASVLDPDRSPERPGPGPVTDAVLGTVGLSVLRRIDGLLPDEHRSLAIGSGTELSRVRAYAPGDDVRLIDPNASARTGEPHVRENVAERSVTAWLALDASPSMNFGTADRRKFDVAEGAALVLGRLASRGGNKLGVTTFGTTESCVLPPRGGRLGLLGLAEVLRQDAQEEGAGAASFRGTLDLVGRLAAGRRGFVAVISDFRGPRDWRGALAGLCARHDVVAVEIRDPREVALVDVGELFLVDPETGRQLCIDTSDRRLRERFAAAAKREREEVAAGLRHSGADHIVLHTRGDWLCTLTGFLRRRAARGAADRPRLGGRR